VANGAITMVALADILIVSTFGCWCFQKPFGFDQKPVGFDQKPFGFDDFDPFLT
jgi:hypothetical protein